MLPLEAVPNFSEGRDPAVIGLLGRELAEYAQLLDIHTDPDHNRSVFTLVGDEAALVDALLAAVGTNKSNLLSATVYLADMKTYDQMNAAWDAWVDPVNTPARATVEAKLAAPGVNVEIMVVAAR